MSQPAIPRSNDPEQPAEETSVEKAWRIAIISFCIFSLITIFIIVIYQIVRLWPSALVKDTCLGIECGLSYDQRFFILVALGGALGAFIHATTSFVDFVGNKKLVYSWLPWYIVRPFIGSALAIIFYLVIRGGLVMTVPPPAGGDGSNNNNNNTTQTAAETKSVNTAEEEAVGSGVDTLQDENISIAAENNNNNAGNNNNRNGNGNGNSADAPVPLNPFGIMAIACLAGMFSKQATDKLREVFETLFQIKKETPRYDPLNNTQAGGTAAALPSSDDNAGDEGETPKS